MTAHARGLAEPSVTFVILNWNQAQMTIECLESLYAQEHTTFRVVLVDNGSTDNSVARVAAEFPDVIQIENGANLGYTVANNVGISRALELGSDYIFLLNNDTVVDAHMLSQLVAVAESDARIGVVGPTMLYFDQPEVIWCAGNSIDWSNGETYRMQDGSHVSAIEKDLPRDVDFITSCAISIKRAVFDDVGFMDERFFIYYDETDWFVRLRAAGWRAVYVPQARMWHKVSATMGESSPRTDYYMIRNKFLFLAKNLKGTERAMALLRLGMRNSKDVAAYTFKSHGGKRTKNRNAKLLAMIDAARGHWGKIRPDTETALQVRS
jgi:hypothetical protein